MDATLIVKADEPIGTISPNVYGYFFENCGETTYPGIWVGEDSPTPNEDGLRKDVLDALARLGPCAIRWPGGWHADFYDWEDGIGPREQRPVRLITERWDSQKGRYGYPEPNDFGTDEFIRFCRRIGAEPYIVVNMITGTARDASRWVEYCNSDVDTHYARLRAENDHPEPYEVRYWNLGNENASLPEGYAHDFLRYADAMKRTDVTADVANLYDTDRKRNIELVASASGAGGRRDQEWQWNEWNRRFVEHIRDFIQRVDHLSVHYYAEGGRTADFTDAQYYQQLAHGPQLEELIRGCISIADAASDGRKELGVVVDEWGRVGNKQEGLWTQINTFREAMFSASTLNIFNRYANRVVMANVSHMVNVGHCLLYADERTMFRTPNYYVWEMYRPHKGATALSTTEESPVISESPLPSEAGGSLRALSASVSTSADGNALTATFLNQSLTEQMRLEVVVQGGSTMGEGSLTVFVSGDVRDVNTFDNPDAVRPPVSEPVKADGPRMTVTVPAHSVNALTVELR